MSRADHEKKILENIQRVSYCTECFQDYPAYTLIRFGNTWKLLCWECYRSALRQVRQDVIKHDKDSLKSE
jgi:hypothetical protein